MNYTETYFVQNLTSGGWMTQAEFGTQREAEDLYAAKRDEHGGTWRVSRQTQVTVLMYSGPEVSH